MEKIVPISYEKTARGMEKSMSEQTDWTVECGDYQSTVFCTDDGSDPDALHRTEWEVRHKGRREPIKTGWAPTPRRAREDAAEALAVVTSYK